MHISQHRFRQMFKTFSTVGPLTSGLPGHSYSPWGRLPCQPMEHMQRNNRILIVLLKATTCIMINITYKYYHYSRLKEFFCQRMHVLNDLTWTNRWWSKVKGEHMNFLLDVHETGAEYLTLERDKEPELITSVIWDCITGGVKKNCWIKG